ncbi:hypothetical protein M0812_23010 [Anaeramoeba flamelloides]|uniref:Reverse transcriptase zinc-binding domain-containing protein n=1 Tax=Anaeramoeba flamelloides TaxID=1746091 RepID=A0AAV7YM24_9EUKA|nr:hypothetical protein M0812_23010 [Anaeramoeba flamelloides]
MKVNHATINNAEVVLNALFLHNIPYHANYYDIEYVLKPLIHIKELILFLDSNNQFKGCAKLLVEKKEDFQKLLTYSVKNLKFREQKFENINWQSDTLKELEFELEKYRIKQLENSPSWKVHKYLKIISIQNNINKQQRYLKWKGSTSILKLRNFTNYLNRYSYVMNKDKSKYCKLCKKSKKIDIIEDLDHFLWNCPAYENNRKIWISELKKFNISNILKNNITIFDIIRKRDSLYLLALIGNKFIFESLTKFLNHNLGIRANKRN